MDFTQRLLRDSGLAPGHHVLDVGCGQGVVSRMMAEIVGPTGSVTGIDRDADALATAREAGGVEYHEADVTDWQAPRLFDIAFCRRVLMYQPDRVAMLRAMAAHLRPGGLVLLQEHDATLHTASVPMPLHERAQGWIWSTVEKEGATLSTGRDLHALLTQAGLEPQHVRAEAVVQTPTQPYATAQIVRLMIPRIVMRGVATEAEMQIETLEDRLAQERRETGGTFIGELMFGAWAAKRQ